jgi:hypothetical protein
VLLRESTRAAKTSPEAIMPWVTTDAIALTDFLALTNIHDPTIASDCQAAVNAAVLIGSFAAAGKHSALVLQTTQVLPGPAEDHARAETGEAASASLGETVENAIAPFTLLIRSEWTVQGVLVAACEHRDGALGLSADRLGLLCHVDGLSVKYDCKGYIFTPGEIIIRRQTATI